MYFLKLKGNELAEPEARALIETYEAKLIKKACDDILFTNKKLPFNRLAYSRFACKTFRKSTDLGQYKVIGSRKYELNLPKELKGKVNLKTSENIIRVVECEKPIAGIQLWERDSLNINPPFKPYISLKPELARCLVNLCRVKKGESIMDPFCGSATTLMQAGFMNIKCTGVDADSKMILGSALNMNHFNINANLIQSDIKNFKPAKKYDGIVTDLPYGRSSKLFGGEKEELYDFSLKKFSDWLKPKKFCVVVANEKLQCSELKLEEVIKVKVHKSLNRFVHIFQNRKVFK